METLLQTKKYSAIFSASNIIKAITILFIALFLYTAVSKLRNLDVFFGTLDSTPLIKPFASFITYAVPFAEIFISLLLIFNTPLGERKIHSRKIGLIAGGSLMLLFTLYIIVTLSLYDQKTLVCSCGGLTSKLSWTEHIFFNLGFVVLAIWALILYNKHPQPIKNFFLQGKKEYSENPKF